MLGRNPKTSSAWAWCHRPVIPELRRLRQKDSKLEASMRYIVRHCLEKKKKRKERKEKEKRNPKISEDKGPNLAHCRCTSFAGGMPMVFFCPGSEPD
jgi:hypothetical protein